MKKPKARKPHFTEQEVLKFLLAWSASLDTYQVVRSQDGTERLKFRNEYGEEIMTMIDEPGMEVAAIKYLIANGTAPQME